MSRCWGVLGLPVLGRSSVHSPEFFRGPLAADTNSEDSSSGWDWWFKCPLVLPLSSVADSFLFLPCFSSLFDVPAFWVAWRFIIFNLIGFGLILTVHCPFSSSTISTSSSDSSSTREFSSFRFLFTSSWKDLVSALWNNAKYKLLEASSIFTYHVFYYEVFPMKD